MKRLSFLMTLFGIGAAKAQKFGAGWRKIKDHPNCYEHEDGKSMACGSSEVTTVPLTVHGGKPKPRNGECPVRGTMAEPFRPEKVTETQWRQVFAEDRKRYPGFRMMPTEVDVTPTSRRIDCAHCGVTFKQEAEK